MAIRIKARSGESAEQMMRRFKKLCEKEGLTKDIKKRAFYEKPSERKQRALRKAVKRRQQLAMGGPALPRQQQQQQRPMSGPRQRNSG
jgi:small subunit ribosomal protein S21